LDKKSTGEQVDQIKKVFSRPSFSAQIVSFTCITEMEIINSILPPLLLPPVQPVMMISAFDMDSNCVGRFQGASFWLSCRYGESNGWYCFSMPVNSDSALIFGREIYSEPKKMAEVVFEQSWKEVNASVKRMGKEIVKMQAGKQKPLDPVDTGFTAFHFKYSFLPDGSGFAYGPFLVAVENEQKNELVYACDGEIKLFGSEFDPVADLKIVRLKQVRYFKGHLTTCGKILSPVEPEKFWPYLFPRMDNPLLWEV